MTREDLFSRIRHALRLTGARGFSLRQTMMLMVLLSVATPAVLFFIFQHQLSDDSQRTLLTNAKRDVMAMGVASIAEPMWSIDEAALREVAKKIIENPQVVALRIHESRPGAEAITLSKPGVNLVKMDEDSTEEVVQVEHRLEEVVRNGEALGTLHLWFNRSFEEELLSTRRNEMLGLVVVQVVLSLAVLMAVLANRVFSPIALLKAQASSLVSDVKSQSKVKWVRSDEIGQLGRHLDDVRGHLAKLFNELEEKNRQLAKAALYDALTGLCNRSLFHDLVDRELKQARRFEEKMGLFFIDLDHFKVINDSMGHDAGDTVLIEAARRMRSVFREVDVVCRQSGDEFLVMVRDIQHWEQLGEMADRCIKSIEKPIALGAMSTRISASIGIVKYPGDGEDFEGLIKEADTAMYHAKALGRGRYCFFDSALNSSLRDNIQLAQELAIGIAQGQLVLHYQPQIDAGSGRLVGVEALVRWQHPKRGLLYPGSFISIAEESGRVADMGAWTLQAACEQVAQWQARGLNVGQIAVNVSALEFRDHRLIDSLQAALEKSGISPDRLDIEITESVLMADTETSQLVIERMREIGVGIAIDDFGTGYSSLAYLKRLRPTQIKIDQSFVRDIDTGEDSRAIVKGILGLASALGLSVVAEGVETVEHRNFLAESGCPILQGYLIAKPLAQHQFEAWAENWEKVSVSREVL